jgi:hypothetical protein
VTLGKLTRAEAVRLLEGRGAEYYVQSAEDLYKALEQDFRLKFADAVRDDGELFFLDKEERETTNGWRLARRECVWQAYTRRYLDLQMRRAYFGREPQISARDKPDIIGVALDGIKKEEVVVEVKLTDNQEVLTALEDQLLGQYLNQTSRRHGIYLVIYLDGAENRGVRKLQAKSLKANLDGYRAFLEAERIRLAQANPHVRLAVVVVDGVHLSCPMPKAAPVAPAPSAVHAAALATRVPFRPNPRLDLKLSDKFSRRRR